MPFSITVKHISIKWLAAVKADDVVLSCRCLKTVWRGWQSATSLLRATPSPIADHTRQPTSNGDIRQLSLNSMIVGLHSLQLYEKYGTVSEDRW